MHISKTDREHLPLRRNGIKMNKPETKKESRNDDIPMHEKTKDQKTIEFEKQANAAKIANNLSTLAHQLKKAYDNTPSGELFQWPTNVYITVPSYL